jgi:hypothetical protein
MRSAKNVVANLSLSIGSALRTQFGDRGRMCSLHPARQTRDRSATSLMLSLDQNARERGGIDCRAELAVEAGTAGSERDRFTWDSTRQATARQENCSAESPP